MVPSSIRQNLASLRSRERVLKFAWGAACWLAVTLLLLFICGLVDWLIDRQRDTPFAIRFGMFVLQFLVAGLGGLLFLLLPQIRRLPDTLLALRVEDEMREFDHRLISAVQLNQPDADTAGMSRELIGVMTHEAEKLTKRVGGFAQIADHRRLLWGGSVLGPILVLFVLPFLIWPGVCFALLGRQALLDIDVPHSVKLKSIAATHWPIGEKIKIYMRVEGAWSRDQEGTLHVTPEGSFFGDRYPLTFDREDKDGPIFVAEVEPSSVNLTYTARLADGRTKAPYSMTLVPRPVVAEDRAWIRLPAFCGLRPAAPGRTTEERRYEVPQETGKVVGIPGSTVRVQFEVDSNQHQAELVLLAPDQLDPKRSDEDTKLLEKDRRTIPMQIKTGKKTEFAADGTPTLVDAIVAEATFDLSESITGFRLSVKDQHGFENLSPPRWSVKLIPEPPPHVALLRDTFSDKSGEADFDVEGIPVPIGGNLRIPYECSGKYGLGKAQVLYRILKKHESGEQPAEEEDWIASPLPESFTNARTNPFNPKTGMFLNTTFDESVGFHAVPSLNPELQLGRTHGGGRYFLKTSGLLDKKTGKALQLKTGDLIEYCVKVYAPSRQPEASTPFAVSSTRVAEVVDGDGFRKWLTNVAQEDARVKELYKKEKEVLNPR